MFLHWISTDFAIVIVIFQIYYSRNVAVVLHAIPFAVFILMPFFLPLFDSGFYSCFTAFYDFVKGGFFYCTFPCDYHASMIAYIINFFFRIAFTCGRSYTGNCFPSYIFHHEIVVLGLCHELVCLLSMLLYHPS